MEEDDLLVPFPHRHIVIGDGLLGVGQICQLVIMGGEEGAAADAVVQVLGDGPGDGEAVKGGGAAADLVENDERARWRG